MLARNLVETTATDERVYAFEWERITSIEENAKTLREGLPIELLQKISSFVLDMGIENTHVRSITKVPDILRTDKWFAEHMAAAVYSDNYPTIAIDISSPYNNWKDWGRVWTYYHDKFSRLLFVVSRFKEPNIFALAEIVYFAADSPLFIRLDKGNPIVLARNVSAVRNSGSNDERPIEHMLVNTFSGVDGDIDETMLGLTHIAVELGRRHRAVGTRLSREGFRRKMCDWVMAQCDTNHQLEQTTAHRAIDMGRYHITTSSYNEWVIDQPKSSPRKHRAA